MSFQSRNVDAEQPTHEPTAHARRRFYAARNWVLSPRTPPQQIARSAEEKPIRTFSGSPESDRQEREPASIGSSFNTSPLVTVPLAPTPPSRRTDSDLDDTTTTDDLYGPDRLFGPALAPSGGPRAATAAPVQSRSHLDAPYRPSNLALHGILSHGMAPPDFTGALLGGAPAEGNPKESGNPALSNPGQYFKDALARDAGTVTPGVDDTPYILYALDALTGNIPTISSGVGDSNSSSNTNSYSSRHVQDEGLSYNQPPSMSRGPPPDTDVAALGPLSRDAATLRPPALNPPNQGSATPGTAALESTVPRSTALQLPPPVHSGPDHRYAAIPHTHETESNQLLPRITTDARGVSGSSNTSLSTLVHTGSQLVRPSLQAPCLKDSWAYLDHRRFSPQAQHAFPAADFKPAILRPLSLAVAMAMCLLMVAGLMFCAIYSKVHKGLTVYGGSIYGGQYFVFRILPQLLAAIVLLYTSSVASAVTRIQPFVRMAGAGNTCSGDHKDSMFTNLYPRSFVWPDVFNTAPWTVCLPLFVIWLLNFALPIQSALFSIILVDGEWRWATVQGVAWTLVVLYIFLTAAVVMLLVYWYNRQTGLIWDPRSIADFIVLISSGNNRANYRGTELLATRDELRTALRRGSNDKVGYWAWRDGRNNDIWHGIGTDRSDNAWAENQAAGEKTEGRPRNTASQWVGERQAAGEGVLAGSDVEALALSPHSANTRYRHLPWCLRSGPLLCFVVAAFFLLLALFIVSFLPSTSIKAGFLPRVVTLPAKGAFSAANFLYSFLPALLGQIMFLLFKSLDLSLRVLQPWAELAKHAGGAGPERSILVDYAACLPLQSVLHAARNQHWRVAAISLMSTLFALLPVLAGGMFQALTIPSSGEVRMMPNIVVYGLVLAFLVLYFVCLVAMLPARKHFQLPHAVTCIAEVLSFCTNDDLAGEPAFKKALSKEVLCNQLGMGMRPTDRSHWIFATGTSGDDRRLGIRRLRRYTELTNRPSGRRPPQLAN